MPSDTNYKPDLGTYLLRAGLKPTTAIWLENVPLSDIVVLNRDSFSTMLHYGWDGNLYAASLAFDADIFKQLMEMVTPAVRQKLRSAAIGRTLPFMLALPALIELRSVECVLGSAVQTPKESFIPLVIKSLPVG